MDPALKAALSQPDIDDVLLAAVDHADIRIRKFIWRGFKPKASKIAKELMVGDKAAKDFVNEVLRRLCDGTRTYNPEKSLIDNLKSVIDSLVWSEKKSSDRAGVVDFAQQPGDPEELVNPIATAVCPKDSPDDAKVNDEITEAQKQCFKMIKASFDGDRETQEYLDALEQGFYEIEVVSELTGIPKEKIYEIRRKLKNHAPSLFGVPNYRALKRKISEGL